MKKLIIMIILFVYTNVIYSIDKPKDIKNISRSNDRANTYIINLKKMKNEEIKQTFERMIIAGKYLQENYPEVNFLQIFIDDDYNYLGITINNKQLNLAGKEINKEVLEDARNKTYKHMNDWALEKLNED